MLKNMLVLLVIYLSINPVIGQPASSTGIDKWKGYERVNFSIAGHAAYFVKPAKPLAGNPWVWRASFPDWHTEMDSFLLVKGLYIAYISIDNEYGSPYAMQVWDRFYNYLVDSFFLSSKVALEAVSRGALYAYGWAKRNPDKVNCIYAETPVCDIKSWPGGKGTGIGDSASWKQLLQVYRMNETEAMAFNDNPIDHLEGLAAFKVPLLHIISLNDQAAPPAENSDILVKRYYDLGGPVMVYPVTTGPMELYNHHFPIEHADRWADFITSYCYPVKNPLPAEQYVNIRGGLHNSYATIAKNKNVTVAFLGGSITYNPGWRDKVCSYLKERFPGTRFRFIAAGIPSLGSLPHAFRLQRDILDSGKIDLLFVEAAVNDRANNTDSLTQVQSMEGIILHAKNNNPAMDIVMMSFADPAKIQDYHNGVTPVEVFNHELVAAHYQLPSLNAAKEIYDKLNNHEFSWEYDFKDLHPSPFGQELYFAAIKKLLQQSFEDSSLPARSSILPKPLNNSSFIKGKYTAIQNAKYDEAWKVVNDWVPADKLPTRDGFVHVPMLVANQPGASLSFSFKGTAVGIAIVSGADAGTISYSIDQGGYKKMDLYTPWSSMLHLPWYLILGRSLKNEKHIVRIKIDEESNKQSEGHACRIVHFLVNEGR
ncbi:MAG: glycosyl hydrolase repeat-containing protein [Chitinophagaceae bacterium]|nr:glycosyl hydrolase repeat-containing protein [Chitinophagaceae bacterium]